MATSTQLPGGKTVYAGSRVDSGLNNLQRQVTEIGQEV